VAARLTPMSRKLRYPITTHARENSPNEVSPREETSFGMAITRTRNVQPSPIKFRVALRASNEEDVSLGATTAVISGTSPDSAVTTTSVSDKWVISKARNAGVRTRQDLRKRSGVSLASKSCGLPTGSANRLVLPQAWWNLRF